MRPHHVGSTVAGRHSPRLFTIAHMTGEPATCRRQRQPTSPLPSVQRSGGSALRGATSRPTARRCPGSAAQRSQSPDRAGSVAAAPGRCQSRSRRDPRPPPRSASRDACLARWPGAAGLARAPGADSQSEDRPRTPPHEHRAGRCGPRADQLAVRTPEAPDRGLSLRGRSRATHREAPSAARRRTLRGWSWSPVEAYGNRRRASVQSRTQPGYDSGRCSVSDHQLRVDSVEAGATRPNLSTRIATKKVGQLAGRR
jgi:hypothetical protein